MPATWLAEYFADTFQFTLTGDTRKIDLGHVILTRSGQQVARALRTEPAPAVLAHVTSEWARQGVVVERVTK
jgi:hypothetical protein